MSELRGGEGADLRLSVDERLEAVFRLAPAGMLISRLADARVRAVNPAFLDALNATEAEVVGRTAFELGLWSDAATRDAIVAELEAGRALRRREVPYRRPDGRRGWTLVSADLVTVDGEPHVLWVVEENTEARLRARALEGVVSGVAGRVGRAYFQALVRELAGALDVTHAVAARVSGDGARVDVIASWADGAQGPEFQCDTATSPCAEVLRGVSCLVAQGVQERFPEDPVLGQMGAESFLGVPLVSTSGAVLGALAVLDRRPLGAGDALRDTLALFAARASAELERLEAEEARRASEERYRSVVTSLHEGILLFDRTGNVVEFNPAAARILQLDEEQMLGRRPAPADNEPIHLDGAPFTRDERLSLHTLATGNPVFGVVIGIRRPSGTTWTLNNSLPVAFGADGKPSSVVVSFTDISEQVEALRSLSASEERHRSVIETLAEGIVLVGADGRIVACNGSAERILKLTADQICERTPLDPRWGIVREDGSPFPPAELPAVHTLRTGEPRTGVLMGVRAPDGSLSWVSVNSRRTPAAPDASEGLVVVSFVDITERRRTEAALRESEERYRTVVASLAEGILVLNAQRSVVACNESAAAIFGARVEQLLGPIDEKPWRAVREDGSPFPVAELPGATTLATGRPQSGVVMGIRGEGFAPRWISVNSQPLRHEGAGRPLAVVLSLTDVTERKRAEDERRRLEQELFQAQKLEALGTLAGGVAHDFNNLLAAIMGNVDLARLDLPAGHHALSGLDEAMVAAHRARELIQRLLAFARRRETVRKPMPLVPVVGEVLRLVRNTLPPRVAIVTDLPEPSPVVLADETQLHQIVLNLSANAGHAMRGTGGTLGVRVGTVVLDAAGAAAHEGLSAGAHAFLEVTDTGTGMDADTKRRLFEPFFTTKPVGEGTGLGLPVVHGIVRAHGGAIEVESSPGAGSRFRVLLPLVT